MKVLSIVGDRDSGKTMLIENLIRILKKRGKVGCVKHSKSGFDIQGKDTHRFKIAGADVVFGISEKETIKITEEKEIEKVLDELSDEGMDFVIVEGFKDSSIPKIALGDVSAKNILRRMHKPKIEEIVEIISNLDDWVTLGSIVRKLRRTPETGGIGIFNGIVKGKKNEKEIKEIGFEDIDERRIEGIKKDLMKREGVIDVQIHHRKGPIEAGEDILYVAVSGKRREDIFSALRDAVERIKEEFPVKYEIENERPGN
ncbi:MAG: molybdopterin-guanine dinucleotide biosynthesis protein B [Candidatus Syntropharchaeia archaeon]